MLYLGSIGPDYLLPQMLELFKQLRLARPTAQFLLLSTNAANQVEEARVAAGLPEDAIKVTAVERAAVPAHIALADFSVVFVRPSLSKAGGSPTKLAEVFAMNVPVIANSRVGDLEAIIDYGRNGSVVVHDFEPDTLRAAVEKVLRLSDERRAQIRANSCEFTLEEGVRRYHRIYEQLAGEPVASMAA
jgi:glycosyltransferase involved in cell wall biosynthesis